MSINAERISRTFAEILAQTTYTSFPRLLYNKISIDYGKTWYFRFRGDGEIYVYRGDKDKAKTATVTDNVTLDSPTNDRDWNDSTLVSYSINANTPETVLRTYDFGSVKTRFLHIRSGYYAYGTNRFYISSDGDTWTLIYDGRGTTLILKQTFRYLRWSGYNSESSTGRLYLYTVEAFDLDDYTFKSNTGSLTIKGYEPILWVWLDATSRLILYVYEFDEVKVTPTYYEVNI
jgi:hypothetical protein